MTPFEIIILTIIYAFCYGYAYESLRDENSTAFNIFMVFVAFVEALYVPMILGLTIAKKLNN